MAHCSNPNAQCRDLDRLEWTDSKLSRRRSFLVSSFSSTVWAVFKVAQASIMNVVLPGDEALNG